MGLDIKDFLLGPAWRLSKSDKAKEFLLGKGDQFEKLATGTKEQKRLHNQILQQAMGMSQNANDRLSSDLANSGEGYGQAQDYYKSLLQPGNEAFERFSQPYMNQFNEQILPGIAERFAGSGGLSSSGFAQAVGGAGAGLQSQLAQLFSQLQSQAAGQQTGQYNSLLSGLMGQANQQSQFGLGYQPFAYNLKSGHTGFLPGLLGGFGASFGGPAGGAIGNQAGSTFSNMFR
jgi:hypothetical protein